MKETKKKEIKEYNDEGMQDLPLATMVINEYKQINKDLKNTNVELRNNNKIWIALSIFFLLCLAVETTYIILYWDTMHPHAGAIQIQSDE